MIRTTMIFCLSLAATIAHSQAVLTAALSNSADFEVASLRLAPPPGSGRMMRMGMQGGPGTSDPGRITIENYPLVLLVMKAYNVNRFQLKGIDFGPERFDISAKLPEGATKDQLPGMLQSLLSERLNLKSHFETKEMPVYEMTLASREASLKPHEGDAILQGMANAGTGPSSLDNQGYPMPPPGQFGMARKPDGTAMFRFNGVDIAMKDFAWELSNQLGRTVLDRTGLSGKYDFLLSWTADLGAPQSAPVQVPSPARAELAAPAPDDGASALIHAIKKQLGLKIESKKGPVQILVVDSFEKKPREN